jgi:hypothetical protein
MSYTDEEKAIWWANKRQKAHENWMNVWANHRYVRTQAIILKELQDNGNVLNKKQLDTLRWGMKIENGTHDYAGHKEYLDMQARKDNLPSLAQELYYARNGKPERKINTYVLNHDQIKTITQGQTVYHKSSGNNRQYIIYHYNYREFILGYDMTLINGLYQDNIREITLEDSLFENDYRVVSYRLV